MKKEDKGIVISQLTETVKEYPNFYLTDIEALDAEKTSKLRRECFKQEIKLVVVKNNLLKKALENDAEKTGTIYNMIGNCDLKLGKAKEALNYYNLGLAQEDSGKKMKKEMQYNIIVAYEQMEDWESAKVKLEEYLENYPNDKSAKKEAEFLKTR